MTNRIKTSETSKNKRKKKALSKPDVFREFVLWMSLPASPKDKGTQGDFAKRFEVSERTLADWKKRDDFWEAVEKEWKKWGKQKTTNVIAKFYNKIISEGMSPDFKLWFQFFLNWNEKIEEKVSGGLNVIISYADGKRKGKSK